MPVTLLHIVHPNSRFGEVEFQFFIYFSNYSNFKMNSCVMNGGY